MCRETENNNIEHICYDISGPVILKYTEWIISEAISRNISTLYFLSRDGYLPWKAALTICKSRSIQLECRYLYVSRMSLRMATYCLQGDDMMDMLFHHTACMTPKTLLDRVQFDDEEQKVIFDLLGITDENACLGREDLTAIKNELSDSEYFKKRLMAKSLPAYQTAIQYLKQEKVFEQDKVALVDSGWNGTLQKSLNCLLRSQNFSGKLSGFYFGLVSNPGAENGDYISFYFSWNKGLIRKTMFDNNVFECLLPANHPMTIGYKKQNDTISPVFSTANQSDFKDLQIFYTLKYMESRIKQTADQKSSKEEVSECYRILKRIMVFPISDELKTLGNIAFCDDFTDGYLFPLVSGSDTNKIKQLTVPARILSRYKKMMSVPENEKFSGSMA